MVNDQLVNVGSVLGKEILNLSDGTFVGRTQNIMVNASEKNVVGILLKQKGLLGNKNIIPLDNVKAFGSHTVTINNFSDVMAVEGVDIIGMSIVTIDGTVLGKVLDFAFDPQSGDICEYVLAGGLLKDLPAEKGILPNNYIVSIGRDVIIAQEKINSSDLANYDDAFYYNWQEIDALLEDLSEEETSSADNETNLDDLVEDLTLKVNKTIEDVTDKLKEVNTEGIADKLKLQADKFTEEARDLLGSVKSKFVTKDKKASSETALAEQIVEQLQGSTVEKPLLDEEGNVIIWPGQIIGVEEVMYAVNVGKLQDLIGLTTPLIFAEDIENIMSAETISNEKDE